MSGGQIPGGSNMGLGGCTNPVSTTPLPSVDRYCGGSLNCVRNIGSSSTIITSGRPNHQTFLNASFAGTDGLSAWRCISIRMKELQTRIGAFVSTITKSRAKIL